MTVLAFILNTLFISSMSVIGVTKHYWFFKLYKIISMKYIMDFSDDLEISLKNNTKFYIFIFHFIQILINN